MKVVIVAFGHPDNVFSLCSNLAERSELTLVYLLPGERYQRGILNFEVADEAYGLHTDQAYFERVFPESLVRFVGNKYRVWTLRMPSLKLGDFRNLRLYWGAINTLKKEGFDIIHYNGFSPYITLFYWRFKSRIPQFWTLHDYKHHSGEKKAFAERLNHYLARLRDLTIIQHYEYLRGKVIEEFDLPPAKVRTLLSGPLDVFRSFQPSYRFCPDSPYLLFFGRISPYKGVDVLLEAYSAIEGEKPKLVIAGSGQFWFDLAPYESDPNIVLINEYIENEDLLGLLERSSFVVVPYRDATHSAVIATAYALSKPVVASDVDGLKEVVVDQVTGRLVAPGAVASLQEALESLFRRPDELKAYTCAIEREKKNGKISWNRITQAYLSLYTEKLEQS